MSLPATTWQTVGPYFRLGCDALNCSEMAVPGVAGERITIQGRVLDGNGDGVPDAMLEIWQADANGKYAHPEDPQQKDLQTEDERGKVVGVNFSGFGRIPTDEQGSFKFSTIKPGPMPGPDGRLQAPHLVVSIFMRGLLIRLVTRIYFANNPQNDEDYVLSLVSPERRATLLASPVAGDKAVLEWNAILQGKGETVFFDI
ncbi:MAG: protocatechuate 3,4-dioxygenase subunit alpha [Acidobacteriia bacterium]|nr:protocatechuate 3,4-dioxygenase subunit alpha [Terriglobia bacterium]